MKYCEGRVHASIYPREEEKPRMEGSWLKLGIPALPAVLMVGSVFAVSANGSKKTLFKWLMLLEKSKIGEIMNKILSAVILAVLLILSVYLILSSIYNYEELPYYKYITIIGYLLLIPGILLFLAAVRIFFLKIKNVIFIFKIMK